MCGDCYNNPFFSEKKCPICRLSMKHPIRNRFAEKHVKNLLVTCEMIGCNVELPYSKMNHHVLVECPEVQVVCRYNELGCNWEGSRKDISTHRHTGINFDVLVHKMRELQSENEEYLDDALAYEDKLNDLELFMWESNITATFDLNHIWKDFNLDSFSEIQQVYRFCGDNKKMIQVMLCFRIQIPESLDDVESHIMLKCKMIVKCLTPQNNRMIRAIVKYVPDRHTKGMWDANISGFIEIAVTRNFESGWFRLMEFDGDFIETVNENVIGQDSGVVKIIAKM